MAFCTGCGAQIDDAASFCTNCGTRVPDSAVAPGAQPATRAAAVGMPPSASSPSYSPQTVGGVQSTVTPSGGTSAVKIVLIVLVIIVGLAVLAFGGLFWAAYKLKHAVRVQQSGEHASVSTPWGHVTSNEDPAKLAKDIGVDVYPGAKPLPGATTVNFGGGGVASVQFESNDPIEKVGNFYAARFPNSTINTADENERTIMASTNQGMVTIALQKQGNGTKISISRIGGNGPSSGTRQTE